jgi:hypothetical protein
MLSWLFRSKAGLVRDLAVERIRRELAERDVLKLSARLQVSETEFSRLVDQVLARQGVINSPLRDTPPRPAASPAASVIRAMGISEYAGPRTPFSEADMSDET